MAERLADELDRAKTNPRPGMLASLVEAQQKDPDVFNDEDLLGTLTLLIGGGFDTTTALLSHAVHWLDGRSTERASLVQDGSRLDTATEEFLRFATPAQGGGRTITANCEIAGHQFRRDDRVWMAYGLTNHDAEAFPDPDKIVVDRFPNRHAAFGLGVHRCIGSNLARMSFKSMIGEVLTRLPDYEIRHDGIVRYEDVGTINGYQHMPAAFSPGPRRGEPLDRVIDRWQVALEAQRA
jgi:cytochrome P450